MIVYVCVCLCGWYMAWQACGLAKVVLASLVQPGVFFNHKHACLSGAPSLFSPLCC